MSEIKKCRLTFEYDEELALAVAHYYGWEKPATHEEMRRWFFANGASVNDDLLHELKHGRAR